MSGYKKLHSIKKILLCVLCILTVVFFACINFMTCAFADDGTDIYGKLDNYLRTVFQNAHFPAMSVTVVDSNKTLYSSTYGSCQSSNTPFLLGSVSKSFTALSVMQLVEQGKIDLNENLSEYIPNAADGDRITVLQLLNHTSGLGEHQNLCNYKIVGKQGEHIYANVNYSLLGKIIEAVSGATYGEYVREHIFEPIGMTDSYADLKTAEENGLIDGYENWFGFNVKTEHKYPQSDKAWITVPAGYLSASTADLGKYLQMYLNGGNGVISAESINLMFYSNVAVEADIPYKYGMGWTLINEPLKEPALRHSGLLETGMSVVYILPQSGIGIAIAINTNDYFVGKDMFDRIDWGVALMLMGDETNLIGTNEYALRHLMYDLAYFAVFAISILPLCLIAIYKKRLLKGKFWVKILLLILLHLLLPVFILLLPQIFFATPLWVAQAFVPDMFAVIIASSVLLFSGGIVKAVLLLRAKLTAGNSCAC